MDKASVNDKRNLLERFLREQLIGPGISGFRYVDINNERFHSDFEHRHPIDNIEEVLDIVPAAIYSTGILFPVDNSSSKDIGVSMDTTEVSTASEEADTDDQSSDDALDTSEGIQELNQMFPNTIGLSYSLQNFSHENESFEFNIEFRYYSKLTNAKDSLISEKYGVLCEVPKASIEQFLLLHKLSDYSIKQCGENLAVLIDSISAQRISELRERLKFIQKEVASELLLETKKIIDLPGLENSNVYLTNLKRRIYDFIKSSINGDLREQLFEISQKLELTENITQHLKNLLDIHSTRGYGLWQSQLIRRKVGLSAINFLSTENRLSLMSNKSENLKVEVIDVDTQKIVTNSLNDIFKYELNDEDGYASLGVNILLNRDTRNISLDTFIKIQLVNTSTPFETNDSNSSRYFSTFNESVNKKSFFGVKISAEDSRIIPLAHKDYENNQNDEFSEEEVTDFIYRQYEDYAIGHGVSVNWFNNGQGIKVETEYIPSTETPEVDTVPRDTSKNLIPKGNNNFEVPEHEFDNKALQFRWLSTLSSASAPDIKNSLINFVDSYGKWIENKRQLPVYSGKYQSIANQELNKCDLDFLRMKKNINLLFQGANQEINLEAFRLMNTAMFMQLWHSQQNAQSMKENISSTSFEDFNINFYQNIASDRIFGPNPACWRPFQLAFILLNLDGILTYDGDFSSNRNELVDLVWFPTGGGKTEAYLGLIALTLIIRRRNYGAKGGGTAAIMRYTLRLLTMQQFQRATLLIMALELIRRWGSHQLGEEPFYIGLWVGNDSLPNKNEDLIKEFKGKLNLDRENKIPLANCPWCKSKIQGEEREDSDSLSVFNKKRVHLKCSNRKCAFSFGIGRNRGNYKGPIPVSLSDEIIYHHPPALLFGTVDKFAQLAHKVNNNSLNSTSDSRRLFGRGNWETGKPSEGYQPPDLVIQDELHLLQGPLGSAVGLFEAAIEQLCTKDGLKAKIISSTATTRNTDIQIAALFNRKTNIFPKPGVQCDDSYYAFYKRHSKTPDINDAKYQSNRKYIGILPTGKTQIWMQMRIASIVMTHRAIYESQFSGRLGPLDFDHLAPTTDVMDSYHTLISYFNSLKEVGKTQSQIQSYLLKEQRRVFNRVIRPKNLMECIYSYGPIKDAELTGRLSGEEVKNELNAVEKKWTPESRFASSVDGVMHHSNVPPDFVIATNMISVGIDVSRFNLIIMNSMPRNTAEYIQASSRVARKDKGLVITLHHPFRARDTSHYERFRSFHCKMYSYVEPISITPFTRKSLNRYFGLYISTIVRHLLPFHNRNSAGDILELRDSELSEIKRFLFNYFEKRKTSMENLPIEIRQLLKEENIRDIQLWIEKALNSWIKTANDCIENGETLVFNNSKSSEYSVQKSLFVGIDEYSEELRNQNWRIPMSLRVIEPGAALRIHSK